MPEPTTTTIQGVTPAQLSRVLFSAREQLSMWNDVIELRGDRRDAKLDDLIADIDNLRTEQGWSANGFGGETDRPGIRVHANIPNPDSVTHFVCLVGEATEGMPVSHSLHTVANHNASKLVCRYCQKSEKQLREEIGL